MHQKFDEKTQVALKYYVYLLIDPATKRPFYVGKGTDNRVFAHVEGSIGMEDPINMKYEKILALRQKSLFPNHVIVRHGLSEASAFEVESSLIDTLRYIGQEVTNLVDGHDADQRGLMTSGEIIRRYHAEDLNEIGADCVIINISRKYKRGFSHENIYEAAKEAWVIAKYRLKNLRYVLVEYRGLIVEVFEVDDWYAVNTAYIDNSGDQKTRTRYGFNGKVAAPELREKYINKSINHRKKRGQASPVRYKL